MCNNADKELTLGYEVYEDIHIPRNRLSAPGNISSFILTSLYILELKNSGIIALHTFYTRSNITPAFGLTPVPF